MLYSLKKSMRDFIKNFLPDHIEYNGLTLPAKHFRLCGLEFRDDAYYVNSTQAEADRLVQHFGLNLSSRVLDVGCGMGRLPTGIIQRVGDIQNYMGIDVMRRPINWCQKYIGSQHPNFHFVHIDVTNQLYNPSGQNINADFRLPSEAQSFDIIYLYSVFSHMTTEHLRQYVKEFQRLLAPSGGVFLTAFIEENVPDMTVNPENYRMKWSAPLHCVRYNRAFFESILTENKLRIRRFDYEKEADGQSGIYIERAE